MRKENKVAKARNWLDMYGFDKIIDDSSGDEKEGAELFERVFTKKFNLRE